MFNNSSNLYGSEWLALVFANRNQQYGAYELRRQSSGMLLKAFLIVVPVFVMFFVGPIIYAHFTKTAIIEIENKRIELDIAAPIHELKKEQPKAEQAKPQIEAPKAAPITQKVKTENFSANIKVVKDNLTTTSPPTMEELQSAVIASTKQEGALVQGNATAPVGNATVVGPGGNEGGVANGNGTEIYEARGVDVYPEFPGGMNAWAKYIQRNLRYPSMAQDEGIQGKVFLSFVVEKDGSITDVKIIKGIGYGCDDEAIRVIKKSPRWKAGMQNNLPVRVRYQMPISYMMNN
ncbi:energy transducer TonB [Pedobacter sp. ASV28]|uniref:energy transducer TonB n=1 Tax=Pedobacter sp. ASV28 TaxID=2795123 RepID=UPI0018EB3C82|nr:energy transducer TonB [Pedobacter sp. ASV28]